MELDTSTAGGAAISPAELDQMLRMRRGASCAQETHAREMLTNEALLGEARRELDLISWRGDPMKAPQPLQRLTRG